MTGKKPLVTGTGQLNSQKKNESNMLISATITDSGSSFSPILFTGDLVEKIKHVAALGFKGVELHIRDPLACNLKGIRDALEKSELTLTTIGTGRSYSEDRISFCDPNPVIRGMAIARIKAITNIFGDFKPKIIIGLIRGLIAHAPSPAQGIEWINEALEACASYAVRQEMIILIEAANRFELDYLHTAEEVCSVIEQLNRPNLKLLLDTFHMNIEERSFIEPLRLFALHLGHMHFSDNNRKYPGAGMIDFKEILRILKEIGFEGTAAFECLPQPDPDTAALRALKTLSSSSL